MNHNQREKEATEAEKERQRELEAKKKLAKPPKDKTEVTIGPTDRSGPDVVLGS
jgi:hypothetical protein